MYDSKSNFLSRESKNEKPMIREHRYIGRGWAVDMFWKHAWTVNINFNQYTMYSLNNVPCTFVLGPGLLKLKCATVDKNSILLVVFTKKKTVCHY